MNAEQLSKVGSDLVQRCGTRDPFQIANALGINVMDDCENLGSLKGMYCIVKRNRFIFLNKDLSPQMKRIVCAHEIGHDRLHRALAKKHGLQEFVLYDMATKPEYEANIVAAEILLDSDEILEYIYDYGYTSEQIARAMHTDINLLLGEENPVWDLLNKRDFTSDGVSLRVIRRWKMLSSFSHSISRSNISGCFVTMCSSSESLALGQNQQPFLRQ